MRQDVPVLYKATSVREEWEGIWSERDVLSEVATSRKQFPEILSLILSLVDEDDRILEGGCGMGRYLIPLMTQGYEIHGVDYAGNALRDLKDHAPDARIFVGDVQFLPYPPDTFDVYLSLGVLEHVIAGPEIGLREAHRVLKDGGFLLITGPCIMTTLPYRIFAVLSKRVPALERLLPDGIRTEGSPSEFFEYHYTVSQMSDLVAKAGFEVVRRNHFGQREFLARIPIFSIPRLHCPNRYPGTSGVGTGQIELSIMGRIAEKVVRCLFPAQFAIGWMILARKK